MSSGVRSHDLLRRSRESKFDMNRHRKVPSATALAAAALLLMSSVAHAQQESLTATPVAQPEFVAETDCAEWVGRTHGVHVDCGYVAVPEDRSTRDGNVIRLAAVRLRGSAPSPSPDPVIYLAGGPGESTLQRMYGHIDDARLIWKERDLILVDQRGVGHSEPRLECPHYHRGKAELGEMELDPAEALRQEVDVLLACKRTLSEQGIDVSAYTPEAVAADVVDVARAMGYESFNLYGNSFGTLAAFIVMRDFPETVRAVILDGVWPPQVNATEARHENAASALEALFRRCESDPECVHRYPDLERDLWDAVQRDDTYQGTVWRYDPESWESFEVAVDGHFFLQRVLDSLRSDRWIPYVPFILHRIANRDRDTAWAFVGAEYRFLRGPIDSSAAWASLLCHADGRFADLSGVLADRAAYPRMVDSEAPDLVPAVCAVWHPPTAEPVDRPPVASDILTLLLSGEFDPTTPPRWAEMAATTLSRSHSFVLPMAGHGVGMNTPCGRTLVGAFLNAPGTDPSPACVPAADRKGSGFRTLFLYQPMGRGPGILWRRDTADTADGTRTPTVPRRALVLGVLSILVLHLSALIVWPVAGIVRRPGSRSGVAAPRFGYPRVIAAAIIVLSAGFWWSVRASQEVLVSFLYLPLPDWFSRLLFSALRAPDELRWFTDEVAGNFGYYPWVLPLFSIPYLTAAATVYVLYLAFRSWRKKWWTVLGRAHYSIVAITLAWYPFHLFALGYLF